MGTLRASPAAKNTTKCRALGHRSRRSSSSTPGVPRTATLGYPERPPSLFRGQEQLTACRNPLIFVYIFYFCPSAPSSYLLSTPEPSRRGEPWPSGDGQRRGGQPRHLPPRRPGFLPRFLAPALPRAPPCTGGGGEGAVEASPSGVGFFWGGTRRHRLLGLVWRCHKHGAARREGSR